MTLLCEPCPLCEKPTNLEVDKKTLRTYANGLATVIDGHGLSSEPVHARILHVDKQGCVRAWEVITAVTKSEQMLVTGHKIDAVQDKILSLQEQISSLQKANYSLKQQLKDQGKQYTLNKEGSNLLRKGIRPTDLLNPNLFSSIKTHSDKRGKD